MASTRCWAVVSANDSLLWHARQVAQLPEGDPRRETHLHLMRRLRLAVAIARERGRA